MEASASASTAVRASNHVALGLVVVAAFAIFLALAPSVARLGPSLAAAGNGRHWLGAVGGPWWWALPGDTEPAAGPVPPALGVAGELAAVPAPPGPIPSSGGGITPPGNPGGSGGGNPPPGGGGGGEGSGHHALFRRLTSTQQHNVLQALKGHPRNIPGWLQHRLQHHHG